MVIVITQALTIVSCSFSRLWIPLLDYSLDVNSCQISLNNVTFFQIAIYDFTMLHLYV